MDAFLCCCDDPFSGQLHALSVSLGDGLAGTNVVGNQAHDSRLERDCLQYVNRWECKSSRALELAERPRRKQSIESKSRGGEDVFNVTAREIVDQHTTVIQLSDREAGRSVLVRRASRQPASLAGSPDAVEA